MLLRRTLGAILFSALVFQSAQALEIRSSYFNLNTAMDWMQVNPIQEKDGNFSATFADANLDTIVTVTVTPGNFGAEAAAYATADRMRAARLDVGDVASVGEGIFTLTFVLKDSTPGICYFKDDGERYGVINILGKDHTPGYQFIKQFTDVNFDVLPKIDK